MDVAIIGTGFIGRTLGNKLATAGITVLFGTRHPGDGSTSTPGTREVSIDEALASTEVVLLAIPGAAVADFTADHGAALAGHLVIDATNQMGAPVANARALLPSEVRYARAFNTLGGENFEDPIFADGRADLFYSAPEADRATLEELIDAVGLRPIYVGEDAEELVDGLFRLWIALAMRQGRGRRLAFRLLED